jgi:hypothetical protein
VHGDKLLQQPLALLRLWQLLDEALAHRFRGQRRSGWRLQRGVAIRDIARRTGLAPNTVRAAIRRAAKPRYRCRRASKLDPFKEEILIRSAQPLQARARF